MVKNISGSSIDLPNSSLPDSVDPGKQGKPIHAIFSKDELNNLEKLSRMQGQYWNANTQNLNTPVNPVSGTGSSVSSTPRLDPPEIPPYSNLNPPFIPPMTTTKNKGSDLSQEEIARGLALMNGQTAEQIMAILVSGQSEIEKLGAIVSQNSAKKYMELKKIQEKAIVDIKDALEKDQNVANFFKTTANTFIAAAAITSLLSVVMTAEVVSFGAATPFLQATAAMSPFLFAGLAGLSAGETYTDVRGKENKSAFIALDHAEKKVSGQIQSSLDRVANHAESDSDAKEHMVTLFKHLHQMKKLILSK